MILPPCGFQGLGNKRVGASLEHAARILGAAAALREASGALMAFDEKPELEGFIERLKTGMTPAAFDAAWSAGHGLQMSEAVASAIAQS